MGETRYFVGTLGGHPKAWADANPEHHAENCVDVQCIGRMAEIVTPGRMARAVEAGNKAYQRHYPSPPYLPALEAAIEAALASLAEEGES